MSYRVSSWLLVASAFLMMAGMHVYFNEVAIPSQELDAANHNKPRGNLSDLYPRWLGARELLLHNRDPYSDDVTAEIQRGYWGRALDPKNPNDPTDENRFAYPLYVVFLLAPTIMLPFRVVQILYIGLATACTGAAVWLWLYALGHRRSTVTVAVGSLLLLGSYPVVQALHLQQPALLVAALLAAAIAATTRGAYWVAGILLSLAMIKPQTAGPIAAWLLFWAAFGWKERKSLCFSFIGTMAALCGGAELLLPHWIWKWRDATAAYMHYTGGSVPPHVQLLFGRYLGGAVQVSLILAAGLFCWTARRDSADTDRFKLAPALLLAVNLAVSPIWHEYDLMFLLPATLLAFHWWNEVSRLKPFQRAIVSLSAFGLGWQWIAAAVLSTIALGFPHLAQTWQILPWLSVFFGPTLALTVLGLIAQSRLWSVE